MSQTDETVRCKPMVHGFLEPSDVKIPVLGRYLYMSSGKQQ